MSAEKAARTITAQQPRTSPIETESTSLVMIYSTSLLLSFFQGLIKNSDVKVLSALAESNFQSDCYLLTIL